MFTYHKLTKDLPALQEEEGGEDHAVLGSASALYRRRRWLRLRSCRGGRRWWRRRPRVRIPVLRRALGRKVRVMRKAVVKVVNRFKEGKAYLGDLFAGNYMFMQVNPSPQLAYLQDKSLVPSAAAAGRINNGRGGILMVKHHHLPHPTCPLPGVV